MSKTKRILAFALAAVLAVVVLSGCKSIAQKVFGSSNEVQEDDTTQWAVLSSDPLMLDGIADTTAKYATARANGALNIVFNGIWSRKTEYFTVPSGLLSIYGCGTTDGGAQKFKVSLWKKVDGGDKYSKLAGNTIIFAISSFSSKLLTLLVQPFLTYAMAEIADLGLAKILSQYANLLIPFVSMGMSNAIIRFGLDKGNSEKQVFTNGLLTILGGFGILILCWPVAQFLPDMAQYGLLIYIYVLMSCLRTLCTQFVRSRQWNKLVAVDGILCTFATLMFYVLYLVGFHWGANGYLLAIISGDLVSVLFLCITGRLWNYVELKGLNRDLWQQMLRFSLPMIPAQISFWVINASDLFFVREMCGGLDGHSGDAWSGLLSTGYFLPTILTTLGLIFYDAWQLSAVTEEEGRARFFTKIFRTYSSVLFCCAAGIIWLCRPVMHVMKSNYYYAWHFVPVQYTKS